MAELNVSLSTTEQSIVNFTNYDNSTNEVFTEQTTVNLTNSMNFTSDFFDFENTTLWNITSSFNYSSGFNNKSVPAEVPFYFDFRDEPWVVPLAAFSFFNIGIILIFEIYVLYKSCGGRRHLFLGQILLFGLFLCSVLGLVYIPKPHWILCGIMRIGVGLAYTIVFGTLLVKCTFLLKLHHGVYFNASFQAFLLFFIVAVEIAIVTQWMVYQPSEVTNTFHSGKLLTVCKESPVQRIVYLIYAMLLMLLVIVASIRTRSIKDNNREALYIGVSIGSCLIIWVAWATLALIFDRRYEAPAEAFGLVCTAIVVFLLVFIPKAIQLACPRGNMGSGSTVGSHSVIHTPSFYHLQPQAVMPSSTHGTLMKQSSLNADYCRAYPDRIWNYDYPSLRQMTPPAIATSEMNSLKKSNGSSYSQPKIY